MDYRIGRLDWDNIQLKSFLTMKEDSVNDFKDGNQTSFVDYS